MSLLLEQEFADWQGAHYCLAVASGGQALQLALRALGVKHGDPVLTNAFTLAPVPGAIRAVGGDPVLVEVTENLVIDLDHLDAMAQRSAASILLVSHMRGHLVDMDRLTERAANIGLTVIEDCAHTMGATWRGMKSGNFGKVGCFSTQSYKHLNSGEGGFLATDDPALMARMVMLSGSYMNFERHGAAPGAAWFADARFDCPNLSARMDALRAAILRPQLKQLDQSIKAWNTRYARLADALTPLSCVTLPRPLKEAQRVGSSLQFRTPDFSAKACVQLLEEMGNHGVELKWFGCPEPLGFTSSHHHWRYLTSGDLPRTDEILRTLFDMRLPLSFSEEDCVHLGKVMRDVLLSLASRHAT